MIPKFKQYFSEIEKRYSELENPCDKESLLLNLDSLARWNNEPMDYPEVKGVNFPKSIHVAHAICHPDCGVQGFIIDGGTQKCQRCGSLLFRGEVVEYKRKI